MGFRFHGNGQFLELFRPIEMHSTSLLLIPQKKINNGISANLQPTALLLTGSCYINSPPWIWKIRRLQCGLSSKLFDHLSNCKQLTLSRCINDTVSISLWRGCTECRLSKVNSRLLVDALQCCQSTAWLSDSADPGVRCDEVFGNACWHRPISASISPSRKLLQNGRKPETIHWSTTNKSALRIDSSVRLDPRDRSAPLIAETGVSPTTFVAVPCVSCLCWQAW